MSKIQISFRYSTLLHLNESMYIYAHIWDQTLRSLMAELLPQVYVDFMHSYETSPTEYQYLIQRCAQIGVEVEQLNNSYTNQNVPLVNATPQNQAIESQQTIIQAPIITPQFQAQVQELPNQTSNTDIEISEEVRNFDYKTKPFEHQYEGVEFGMNVDRFLLGDEMGLGKTKQIIDLGVMKKVKRGYKHCLIICCVNGLKWNWEEEVGIHSNEKCHILGNRLNTKNRWVVKGEAEKLLDIENIKSGKMDDIYFIITNIETMRNKKIAEALKEVCDLGLVNMIAVDEIHKCASDNSQQSKGLLKLTTESMVAMTGSPIMNSPLDMYVPLNWLRYDKHSFYDFKKHFCRTGFQNSITGYKNMEQIQQLLQVMMLRRLKKDVLDLPEKLHSVEYVEMSPKQTRIYNEVVQGLRNEVDLIARAKNPLANLIRLRQATGHTSIISSQISESAKFDRLLELIQEYTAQDHKVIVFSNWTQMVNIIIENTQQYNPAMIIGETKDRQAQKVKFMTDDTCKLIVGTIGAMGTGFTLTAGDIVIFIDEPWTAANKNQAEDRAHRIGAKNNVQIITLIAKNTIDERIHELVERKALISDNLIDNLDCTEITKLLNFLLF